MMAAYLGSSLAVAMAAQEAGPSLLDQALAQQADPTITNIAHQAGILASLGMSMPMAATTVALAGLAFKGLQILEPFTKTLNDIVRKHYLGDEHIVPPKVK
jgi:hypothetical protein